IVGVAKNFSAGSLRIGEAAQGLLVPLVRGDQLSGNRNRLPDAGQSAGSIAKVLLIAVALNISQPGVGIDEVELRLAVAAGLFRHAVQMLEHASDEQFLGPGRSGKLLDGLIQFGEETGAELAKVGGALLGLLALKVGDTRLP